MGESPTCMQWWFACLLCAGIVSGLKKTYPKKGWELLWKTDHKKSKGVCRTPEAQRREPTTLPEEIGESILWEVISKLYFEEWIFLAKKSRAEHFMQRVHPIHRYGVTKGCVYIQNNELLSAVRCRVSGATSWEVKLGVRPEVVVKGLLCSDKRSKHYYRGSLTICCLTL